MPEDEPPAWLEAALGGSTGAAAAGIALVVAAAGHPEGAIAAAGLAPAAKQALQQGALWVRRRWFEQAERAVKEGAAIAGLEPEELVRRLVASPNGGELFWDAVQAAAHSGIEAKIKVLGWALATGALAADETAVDRERVFAAAMAEFEGAHIRVLQHLEFRRGQDPPSVATQDVARLPGVGSTAMSLLGALQRHGAAYPPAVYGAGKSDFPGRWVITAFGIECLNRLRAAGLENEVQGAGE